MPDSQFDSLLPLLRFYLRESGNGNCCDNAAFSDENLLLLLEKHGGNINAAAYEGLMMKAENDAISLPDGIDLPSQRDYWLALAKLHRPCAAHQLPRADEVFDHEYSE